MKVKYVGALRDYSGYGEAARHDIGALNAAGVEITAQIPRYCPEISDYGELDDLINACENRPLGYQIKIIHTTPNVYKQFFEPDKYIIGRAFWETDKIPLEFATNLQLVDEIWTGSEFNKQAIINAGVTKPIYVIPEAIAALPPAVDPYIVQNDDSYKFYSIFEWTERKNPLALLEAYWREFNPNDNVSLTLKTYQVNFGAEKRELINQQIRKLKAKLNFTYYAPVYLFRQLMDRRQVYRFHKTFDCFVSAHRGEGWGIPQMEAMLTENPIISTNIGGIHEYLTHKKDAYLLKYQMVPVDNNNYNAQWYTPDQKWGQVDIDDLRKAMRWAFENQKTAKKMGITGGITVANKFSFSVVGSIMRTRLEKITQDILSPKL